MSQSSQSQEEEESLQQPSFIIRPCVPISKQLSNHALDTVLEVPPGLSTEQQPDLEGHVDQERESFAGSINASTFSETQESAIDWTQKPRPLDESLNSAPPLPPVAEEGAFEDTPASTKAIDPQQSDEAGPATDANDVSRSEPAKEADGAQNDTAGWSALDITVRPQSLEPAPPPTDKTMSMSAPALISHPVPGSPEHDPDLNFNELQGDATDTEEPPNVPTPEPSQPVASPRRLRGAVSAPTRITTPHQTMSPVSKYSSVKSRSGGGVGGPGSKTKAVHSAPGSSKGSGLVDRSARNTREPTPEKDSFEDDSLLKKENPQNYLRAFFSSNSKFGETGEGKSSTSKRVELLNAEAVGDVREAEGEGSAGKDEDGGDTIDWGHSLNSNRPRASTADYENAPGSPTPTWGPSSGPDEPESPLQAGPINGLMSHTNHPPSSPSTQKSSSRQYTYQRSSPPQPTRRFGFANTHSSLNESQSQPVVEDEPLFSSQAVSQGMDLRGEDEEFSQMSAAFPATQMQAPSMTESNNDPRSSSNAKAESLEPTFKTDGSESYERPELEATLRDPPDQPETRADEAPAVPTPPQRTVTVPLHRTLQYNSRRNTPSASPPVTRERTLEVPRNRLLQRRKKGDESGTVSAHASEAFSAPKTPIADQDLADSSATRQQIQPVNGLLQVPTPQGKAIEPSPNQASQVAALAEPEHEAEVPTQVESDGRPMDVDEPPVSNPTIATKYSHSPPISNGAAHEPPKTPARSSSPDPLDQLHTASKSKSKGKEAAVDISPDPGAGSHTINHDHSAHTNVSFPTQRPTPKTTPKAYKRRERRAPKIFSPSEPSFERDAGKKDEGDSDSSSAPEDTEDFSFRPNVREMTAAETRARRSLRGMSSTSGAGPSRLGRASQAVDSDSVSDPEQGRPVKRRKATPKSRSSSSLTDEESSSAPEDPEDETFRVVGKKKSKGKQREVNVASNRGTRGKTHAGSEKEKVVSDLARVKGGRMTRGGKFSVGSSTVSTPASTPARADSRVLAYYDRAYYPARIVGSTSKGYTVKYDDGDYKDGIQATRLRQLVLRKGDAVLPHPMDDTGLLERMEVLCDWNGDKRGVKLKGYESDRDGDGQFLGFVKLKLLRIPARYVEEHFDDRLYVPSTPNVDTPNGVVRHPSPRKNSKHRIFTGLAFMFTTGTEEGTERRNANELKELVEMNGGVVYKSWEPLFDKIVREKLVSPYVPFVVASATRLVMTSKVMIALAKGIPILSDKFLDDSISQSSLARWQPYLLATPRSNHTGSSMSQVVDRQWGAAEWEKDHAFHVEKPFGGLRILYIISDKDDIDNLATTCLLCLGTAEVKSIKLPRVKDAEKALDLLTDPKWDYIVLDDRSVKIPSYLSGNEKMTGILWLKDCLIMGSALPPSLDKGTEEEAKEEESRRKKKDEGGNKKKKGGTAGKREEKEPPKKRQKRK
ncbi:hypothetical protein L202_06406 [Cryptococcus amylolentus CBS 6039]|uniref:BRCT domain-containing protein n=2 Tax=Cryptococcus amylolentus TaxID=104669 RepID=A0A1E3HFR8_9TREE|nr:hypothetical protein L202_06406 [Cryptococcus amylolentus CBS 6039]ODN75209.1 hypothetical protein L202_06406 [Cryptococcus amylolentus CBS 6039]ODO02989.1 hypothetical protein I350_05833 [Cryptococcus amylolentus CBS 6273]